MEQQILQVEKQQNELGFRLDGLEYTIEECVPQLIGALVVQLAKRGHLDLGAFEDDLRSEFNPDSATRDATGLLFSKLAELVSCYRQDGLQGSRYEVVYETRIE